MRNFQEEHIYDRANFTYLHYIVCSQVFWPNRKFKTTVEDVTRRSSWKGLEVSFRGNRGCTNPNSMLPLCYVFWQLEQVVLQKKISSAHLKAITHFFSLCKLLWATEVDLVREVSNIHTTSLSLDFENWYEFSKKKISILSSKCT